MPIESVRAKIGASTGIIYYSSLVKLHTKTPEAAMKKIKVTFEHASGKQETLNMSYPLANCLIDRLVQDGWPWVTPIVDGQRIKGPTECSNAFVTSEGQRIVI
jgi:hypothetical protein